MADIINDNNCCPSIEDGASWPILILNYQPSQMANNFLFLHKKMNISDIEEPLKLSPVFFGASLVFYLNLANSK